MKKFGILLSLHLCFLILPSSAQQELNGQYNLMPWPKTMTTHSGKLLIDNNISITVNGEQNSRVNTAAVRFLRRLTDRTGVFLKEGFPKKNTSATIEVSFNAVAELNIDADESYVLTVNTDKITLQASTDLGALRGLETLLQLVSHDEHSYYFEGAHIKDAPRFVWRGLMIDVARHFQPVDVLKRNLDAMASVKMNVFHWHLTDDQGFRIESKAFPKLHEFASDGQYYTHEQIQEVVAYAANLGIRVVPEFDVPGHATAILTAYPQYSSKADYSYEIERYAGIFDPTLDPTNDDTYVFLETLFTEVAPLFPDEYFHIGGDENEGKHWDENDTIQEFMALHKLQTNHELQTYFNIRLETILKGLGKKLMGWDEIMTDQMPTTAVIHSWRGENEGLPKGGSLIEAAKKGYNTVLSNGYYIDRMLSVKHHYSVDPIGDVVLTEVERRRILGGEATMWSELVTPLTIDSRIWPRTAAIAERFWSEQKVNDLDDMLHRLNDVNKKLEELGITHIRNRAVILRSLNNYQDNEALTTLSKLCEPLKMYSRNEGGTEYKSFSPFNLFADACVVDAEDATEFNMAVAHYLNDPNQDNLQSILENLSQWSTLHEHFETMAVTPKIEALIPLSSNLSKVSLLLGEALSSRNISTEVYTNIAGGLSVLKDPFMDTELVITESLENLLKHCHKHYLNP